ncbi:MAG: hypothetical protein RID09_18755 [Coleofasciculus sp. G1-WW12-02]
MLPQPKKRWTPEYWATWKPFGIGEQYPNNYWEVFRAIWENRDQLPYAWDILNQGVCDGCALGTTGMKDWTLEGIHVFDTPQPKGMRILLSSSALTMKQGSYFIPEEHLWKKRFAPLQKLVTICPTVLLKTRKNVFSGTWCLDFLPVQAFLYRTL